MIFKLPYNTHHETLDNFGSEKHSPLMICYLCSTTPHSTAIQWDWRRGRIQHRFYMNELAADSSTAAAATAATQPQVVNPPFVHSIAFTPDGRYLAAGLGNASVVLLDYQRRKTLVKCTEEAHTAAVCSVHYATAIDADLLVTAGSDSTLLLWGHTALLKCADNGTAPAPLEKVSLLHKPNAVCSNSSCILVADTSSTISIYNRNG
jgi:WD40 repeat protein